MKSKLSVTMVWPVEITAEVRCLSNSNPGMTSPVGGGACGRKTTSNPKDFAEINRHFREVSVIVDSATPPLVHMNTHQLLETKD